MVNKMKMLSMFVLLAVASANMSLNELEIGQTCNSNGGFTVTSFSVSPYPPVGCAVQAVTMTGTFTVDTCPSQINIRETYNDSQNYSQNINISACYKKGDVNSFQFNINTFNCSPGSYKIQVALQVQNPQSTLSCWQYTYTL